MLCLTVNRRRPERQRLLRCASMPPTDLTDPIASFVFIMFYSLWSERVCFLSCCSLQGQQPGAWLDLLATSQPWLKGFISELMAGWMTGQIVNPRDKPLLFESPEASEVKQTATVFVQHSQQHRGRWPSTGKGKRWRGHHFVDSKYSQVRDADNWCYFPFLLILSRNAYHKYFCIHATVYTVHAVRAFLR